MCVRASSTRVVVLFSGFSHDATFFPFEKER